MNQTDIHQEWKKGSNLNCGFSTIANVCSPNCALAGASGTHTVCTCMQHQNLKLTLHASELKETAEELLATTACEVDEEDCMFGKSDMCLGTEDIVTLLQKSHALDTNQVDNVKVQRWTSGVRCKLATHAICLLLTEFC